MKHLAARLACLAIAVTAASAWAQPSVSAARNSRGCSDIVITNNTDHTWVLYVPYQYEGKDYSGNETVYNSESPFTVYPRSTMRWEAWPGSMDCSKNPHFFTLPGRAEDQTAAVEAQRKLYDDSTKQVIANELARQAEQKRQSDALMAKKQAEANARAAQQAAQQAERDRQLQASRNLQAAQEAAKQQQARNIIAAGDPRCNSLTLENYYACKRNMEAQDERDRQARLAAQQQAKMDAEGRALGEQRSQKINSLIAAINPETCSMPGFTASSESERMQIQQTLAQGVAHCQQVALGRNASIQQQQAQIAAAQQQQALQQQQMIAAQQQAEYQAQMQQYAQQSMADAAAGIQSSNNDMRQQAANIQQDNADLEAWLNSN